MARYNPHEDSAEAVYKAAELWRNTCLLADGSIFFSGRELWTKDLLDELDDNFVKNLDAGEGDFFEKLESQLMGGSLQCKQLMAELDRVLDDEGHLDENMRDGGRRQGRLVEGGIVDRPRGNDQPERRRPSRPGDPAR